MTTIRALVPSFVVFALTFWWALQVTPSHAAPPRPLGPKLTLEGRVSKDDFQTLNCTPEHPFWVVGEGFVEARDLRAGQRGLDSDGNEVRILSVDIREEAAAHYNLEVEDFHTYFVSETPGDPAIWVHNSCFDRWVSATEGQFQNKSVAEEAWVLAQETLRRGQKRISRPPSVQNEKLQNYVNDLYKGDRHGYKLGTGSTADAARLELKLGIKIFGKDHVGKSKQYVRDLKRWLAKHRRGDSAAPGDRRVARQLIADMESALAGH